MPEVISIYHKWDSKIIGRLEPGKAAGPDNIPRYAAWILKVCAVHIAPILQIVFTQTFNSGTLPSQLDWLTANIIATRKGIKVQVPVNYRPISLTSVCCKVMKHIIFHSILNYLK